VDRGRGRFADVLRIPTIIDSVPLSLMDVTSNLRRCYRLLEDNARLAFNTRTGDSQRLSALQNDALEFTAVINDVSTLV
jgi:hypothetical protein